jgi:hypothetical protein
MRQVLIRINCSQRAEDKLPLVTANVVKLLKPLLCRASQDMEGIPFVKREYLSARVSGECSNDYFHGCRNDYFQEGWANRILPVR